MATPIINDRKLGADVRRLGLKKLQDILLDDQRPDNEKKYAEDYKKEVFMKIVSNLLPRMQEVTGEDGSPIKVSFSNEFNADTPRTTVENNPSEQAV